jgi:hypothetical protein
VRQTVHVVKACGVFQSQGVTYARRPKTHRIAFLYLIAKFHPCLITQKVAIVLIVNALRWTMGKEGKTRSEMRRERERTSVCPLFSSYETIFNGHVKTHV